MVNQPTIDIIIPNFNKAKYLNECLNSIISQTYRNWKIFLIDDNSQDNSKIILKKFEGNNNIKIFYLDENKGPSFCRNIGLEKSSSELIAFMDSDDIWPENKLEKQINEMLKNNLNFTYTDFYYFFENNPEKKRRAELPASYDYKKFLKHSSMSTSSIILKRKILKNNLFKNVKHEDYLFKCDLLRSGELAHNVKNTYVFYRIEDNGRSSNKLRNFRNLWNINKDENNLNFFNNLLSVISISYNSLKKYGWK